MMSKAAQIVAVLAGMALLACIVISGSGAGRPVELVTKAKQGNQASFSKVWGDWLHKVELQVKAAVDLSSGLGAKKDAKLNNLLKDDMSKDFNSEQKIVKELDSNYGVKTSKKAQSKHAMHAQSIKTSPKAKAAKAIRAAVKAVDVKPRHMGVTKVHDAQIKKPVREAGKYDVTPYGKVLNNDVSRDDAKIASAEARVTAAEHVLLREEGVKSADQERARAAMQGAKNSLRVRGHTAAKQGHAAAKAAKPTRFHKARSAAAELAKEAAKSKELKMMQGALIAELQGTEKGPASHEERREVKQEEQSIGHDLSNWGISRLHAKSVKQHPGEVMEETRHEEKHWLSLLNKWGISH
mmetsp:Transcript_36738/g.57419  ORF Transcript_36738/g.57419 Transcript_36738/m.57419 type:complete len:353 (-) Transcript_36738:1052-2110(-)|eukprot:CAMPEP_0184314106 /NCGR_PEP_ID=MMETSP1049-20130417/71198_1 /TAXON_ID=77928 /ORGANISM="Proteomonas sulcata, Strain CCMP704" /LENGTH=352 /DNA_ID=CAMNT_0026631847 /DNA_START=66 /DNA_END=1124 /DNA_ORIENTATION=-